MKMKFLWLVFVLVTTAQAASVDPNVPNVPLALVFKPTLQQTKAAHLAADVLTRYHYKTMPLDDAMSEKIFDRYLKSLDPDKLFFVQSDIDRFTGLRTLLDDAIINEDLNPPFTIFNVYAQRLSERFTYARTLLKAGFDFRRNESYLYQREKEPWPKTELEMREVWRKRVKNDWLRLKLAGKDDKNIVKTLDKRYVGSMKRIAQLKSQDAFQVFMNAYTMVIEPHTNYMGPRAAEDFDISMKLSLVGIGAGLAEKDDYTTVRELVPGGPAALSGQLKIGDRILGVAEGEGGTMTDIQGLRLDDTVALIRGTADTTILLDVLPVDASPDGKHRRVSLIRKKITLEQQSAKKSVISVTDGTTTRRIGVISLPAFYEDSRARQQGEQNFKSATRDVAHLLDELAKQKIDGLLVDLRNNGGGSLAEAIELTTLFIGQGPVVQQRDAKGHIVIEGDPNLGVAWNGALGVLINRGSASASEIFAAAIQDYGRGLIIGESSFGKGTVQTMINLDQIAKNDKPTFGELKLTVAQFFRINGGTTQLRGVTPDISFPAVIDAESLGESSFDNALPWMQIPPARYSPIGDLKYLQPALLTRHEARVKSDKGFICLRESISNFNLQRKKNLVSLNESERRKERDVEEARLASCEAGKDEGTNTDEVAQDAGNKGPVLDDGLQANERSLDNEQAAEKSGKNAKDVLLDEAAHILGDEVDLLQRNARFLAGAVPPVPLSAEP